LYSIPMRLGVFSPKRRCAGHCMASVAAHMCRESRKINQNRIRGLGSNSVNIGEIAPLHLEPRRRIAEAIGD
jgi:hypothetical protein